MRKYDKYIVISIIISLGFIFHWKYINEFPSHIHAWAQSDRYALALGFLKNDFDVFHPQTFVMNKQFPDEFKNPTDNSITAVDFPIHDYVPAVIMKSFKTTSPWCFRVYILLYSFIGLFFFFRLSFLFTKDIFKSILIVVFAATSPVFVYYQSGFLPTIPSLANAIIGLYFYFKNIKTKKQIAFYLSILFLTLAVLSRTSFAIILITIFCVEFLKFVKIKKIEINKLIAILVSIIILLAYYFYNNHLRNVYGSMFLNNILPASGIEEVKLILATIYEKWAFQYFSNIHYLIFILIFLAAIIFSLKSKNLIGKIERKGILILLIMLIGNIMFFVLMMKQFAYHDYYFLDTFFIPLILFLLILLRLLPDFSFKYRNIFFTVFLISISIVLISNAINSQKNRRKTKSYSNLALMISNFQKSKDFLDFLNISREAKILVIDAYAPNIPFILMDRKGFVVMNTTYENIKESLSWTYDYIIFQNDLFMSEIYKNYPEITSKIKRIGYNGKISVYKLMIKENDCSLKEFFGLKNRKPVLSEIITFDTIINEFWSNYSLTSKISHSGKNSSYLSGNEKFGIGFTIKQFTELNQSNNILFFNAFILKELNIINNCIITVTLKSKDETIYYKSFDISKDIKIINKWEEINLFFHLPNPENKNVELKLYVWNKGKNSLFFDDVKIELY
ncbi:MAG: hypothetical protein JEY97_07125 [Bacteroidales bacterium]|nr:hypothetical protein [Bacteroidales bacterium]